MLANTGSTEVLNYLVKTGPISLADLAFRFDDLPSVLGALNEMQERGEVDIIGTHPSNRASTSVLDFIINKISQSDRSQEAYSFLRNLPETQATVRLTEKGISKAFR